MRKELKRPNPQSTTCNGRIQAMRFAIRELVDGQAPKGLVMTSLAFSSLRK